VYSSCPQTTRGGRPSTSGSCPLRNISLSCIRDYGAEKGTEMVVGVGLLKELNRGNCSSETFPKYSRLSGIAAALLVVFFHTGTPAGADEFDALAAYSEAGSLNDRWQACAASYVRRRIQSRTASDALASSALRSCRPQEERLRRFLISRIGKRSAENVVTVLHQRYRADLAAAIDELRARD